jgi:hypothetical protein
LFENIPLQPGWYHHFYSRLASSKSSYFTSLWNLNEEWEDIVKLSSLSLQDPFKYKARKRSSAIAQTIIDKNGDLQISKIKELKFFLEKEGHIPLPGAAGDQDMLEHFIFILSRFLHEPKFKNIMRKFQLPLCHKYAESLIRESVGKPHNESLVDRDVKVAVLSACLYPLRQNVGSCFATAPAIMIQKEQVENVLYDLYELLSTGKMTRTVEGHQHSVPLSPSIGVAELKKSLRFLLDVAPSDIPLSLCRPLELAGLIKKNMDLKERSIWWQHALKRFLVSQEIFTVESFFESVVFEYFEITKEQMDHFKIFEKEIGKRARRIEVVENTSILKKNEKFYKAEEILHKVRWYFLMMTEDPLARAWEYTIASFSEVKMDFSRWNLFIGLGLNHSEKNGIGKVIYDFVDQKIGDSNVKLEEYQRDYEIAFDQLRAVETLLKQASSESEARRLKAEFQSRSHHMHACLELRDKFYKKASFYSQLFSFFVEKLDKSFPESFQEIYDPEMQDVEVKEYEDAPAGFRLVYKHGRRDASLWSMIRSEEQFVDALVDFFKQIEPSIASECSEKGIEDDAKEIISLIILHVRTQEFIKSSYKRIAQQGDDPKKKPWCYISGGAMNSLIKAYFIQQREIDEETFTVEGGLDLLTLIIETLKSIPYNFSAYFPKESKKKILMHSPTHAFLLEPYQEKFFIGWDNNRFTYTWIRDHVIEIFLQFYQRMILNEGEQIFLLHSFIKLVSPDVGSFLLQNVTQAQSSTIKEWAERVLSCVQKNLFFEDVLSSFLYRSLPLVHSDSAKSVLYGIVREKVGPQASAMIDEIDFSHQEYLTAEVVKEMAKGLLFLSLEKLGTHFDVDEYVSKKAELMGFSAPLPLIFADSNWSQNKFAFVVSPIHQQVELWRVPGVGAEGIRMSSWLPFLSKRAKQPWGIYIKPQQYSTIFEKKM